MPIGINSDCLTYRLKINDLDCCFIPRENHSHRRPFRFLLERDEDWYQQTSLFVSPLEDRLSYS
jgi:hypothetical protein